MARHNTSSEIHLPTVIAVAVIVWASTTVLHELLGHGGMCALVGGTPRAVSTTEFRCDDVVGWQYKQVVAAGSVANLLAAFAGSVALRLVPNLAPVPRYFLWLFITINLFHAGSYMLIGPFTGYGDWANFIAGWEPRLVWQVFITGLGAGLCWVGQRIAALPDWQPLLGREPAGRRSRMHLLTRVPLLTALVMNVLAGVLSPLRFEWVIPTSLLAPLVCVWLVNAPTWPQADNPVPAVLITPQRAWVVAGVICAIVFVGVLGPGIGSFAGYPLARP